MIEISRLTREFVYVDIESPDDLTPTQAEMAFVGPESTPEEEDWAESEIDGKSVRTLVGYQGVAPLNPGDYQVWVRLTDNPERIVRKSGLLVVE